MKEGDERMKETVSIAMATFNGARFLCEQLQSIAEQTYRPAELIISDDGSTDRTLDIAASFAASAPFPVRIHCNKRRLGYRANFMRAAQLCQSDLIAFSDQDDVWAADKIASCIAYFRDERVLLTFHNASVVDAELRELGTFYGHGAHLPLNQPSSLHPWLTVPGFSMIFRRKLLSLDILWSKSIDQWHPESPLAHDQWFLFLASALGIVAYVQQPLAQYRQHDANVFGSGSSGRAKAPVSWPARIGQLLRVWGVDISGVMEAAARARGAILDTASSLLDEQDGQKALIAAHMYTRLAQRYHVRRQLYSEPSSSRRFKAYRELFRMNAYSGDVWGLGWRTGLKDICLGVSFGHRINRGD